MKVIIFQFVLMIINIFLAENINSKTPKLNYFVAGMCFAIALLKLLDLNN